MGMSGFKSNGDYDAWTRTVIKTQTEDVKAAIQSGDWNIEAIENLDYTTCMYIAEDVEMVKEHTVFFIDFGKFFGYSAIVFYGNAHIYHASDYELHHKSLEGDKKSLKAFYIKALNNKLFTDDELINSAPKSYDELGRRRNFLNNYIGQRMNHVSFFHIFNDEKVAEAYTRETKNLYRSDVAYAFYDDRDFVERMERLEEATKDWEIKIADDLDFWTDAFYYEFMNYECIYGGRYSEAGEAATRKPMSKWSDVQKKAYRKAKVKHDKYWEERDY